MLRLFNYLTHQKEDFNQIDKKSISIYGCGPTVYDYAHIGNFTSFIFYDQLNRTFKFLFKDLRIKFVINITDIDDKIIAKANDYLNSNLKADNLLLERLDDTEKNLNSICKTITNYYTEKLFEDLNELNISLDDYIFPRATDYLVQMSKLITKLDRLDLIYEVDDGLYLDVIKYNDNIAEYGRLKKNVLKLDNITRLESKQTKHPADFAIWKFSKENEPIYTIETELNGKKSTIEGRPGWHLECSAMSTSLLGEVFDIHLGGIDLLFPHHENELAQCLGKLANFFIYREHLQIDSVKMSKSLDNFLVLKDILSKYSANSFRLLLYMSKHSSVINFTDSSLEQAQSLVLKILEYYSLLILNIQSTKNNEETSIYRDKIKSALENDLNFPEVISIINQIIEKKALGSEIKVLFDEIIELLGLNFKELHMTLSRDIKSLLQERAISRENGDFDSADKLRQKIEDSGFKIIDLKSEQLIYQKLNA